MYQQHFLEVFQGHFKKGTNKRGMKDYWTKERRINIWETTFNSQTFIFNSMAIFFDLPFHMLSYFRVIHNL